MSYYAATIIIEKQTQMNDSQILESLKLYRCNDWLLGDENVMYQDCIGLRNIDKIHVCSTDELIIITGFPAVELCFKGKNIPFESFIGNSKFFIFLSEQISMQHVICLGENRTYLRKKVVDNGDYIRSQKGGDYGTLFHEEVQYFKHDKVTTTFDTNIRDASTITNEEKNNNDAYLSGENDYDIALQVIRRTFNSLSFNNNKELENYLFSLKFNKGIGFELNEDYWKSIKLVIGKFEIKYEASDFLNYKLSKLGFAKVTYDAPAPRDAFPTTKFTLDNNGLKLVVEHFHNETYQRSDFLVFIDNYIELPKQLEDLLVRNSYMNIKCNYPFYSYSILTSHYIINKCRDRIYIKRELEAIVDFLNNDFEFLQILKSYSSDSLFTVFANTELWNLALDKITNSINILSENLYVGELNFCLVHIYITKDLDRFKILEDLLTMTFETIDQIEKNRILNVISELKHMLSD